MRWQGELERKYFNLNEVYSISPILGRLGLAWRGLDKSLQEERFHIHTQNNNKNKK